jgi:putative PIN family toxin of toxin-antitoxin system
MFKIVLDTNVLISALITRGKSRTLLFKMVEGRAQLVLSRGILEEVARVALDEKIRKYVTEGDVAVFLQILNKTAEVVKLRSRFKVVKDDPSDDEVLRAAYDAEVDFIVSGDKHLLSLTEFRGIQILTVNEILRILQ